MTGQPANPYAQAARTYWAAGWRGILPLPAQAKKPVPDGYTGADGTDPSWPDIQTWTDDGVTVGRGHWPAGNIALRLPDTIIGIDVDQYADKPGAHTLDVLTAAVGEPLPPTWRSSAREAPSGIYLYRVPPGLHWPGVLGPGIELIQRRHRYAVVWPSIHPEGSTYDWHTHPAALADIAAGNHGVIPTPADLRQLPAAWVDHLTGGQLAVDHARANVDDTAAENWLRVTGNGSAPCHAMAAVNHEHLQHLDTSTGEARHDLAVKATQALIHLAAEGHRGLDLALSEYRHHWTAKLASEGRTRTDDLAGEWNRMTWGAVRIATAAHPANADADPCEDPFAGLIPADQLAQARADLLTTTVLEQQTLHRGALDRLATGDLEPPQIASTSGPVDSQPAGPSTFDDWTTPPTTSGAAGPHIPAPDVPTNLDQLRAAAVRGAYERLRANRDARAQLDDETALATFTPPAYTHSLALELETPDDAQTYRIDQLVPAGANVLLTASFKAGKTTLVNHLAQCLVDGGKFLDTWPVHRQPGDVVALWNYEVAPGMFRRWLRDQGIENTDRIVILNLRGKRMPLQVAHVANWAAEWLAKHSVTTWIVDPFAAAFKGENENNNSEVGRFLDALDVIKDQAGVQELVMPAHTGRATPEEGMERVRGASRLDDWTDIRWLLTLDVKDGQTERYFRATGRDVDIAEVRLSYDEVARRPFVSGPSRYAQRRDLYDFDVLQAIRIEPGISSTQLRTEVRRLRGTSSNQEVDKTVARLVTTGRITIRKDPDDLRQTARHYLDDTIGDLIAPPAEPPHIPPDPTLPI